MNVLIATLNAKYIHSSLAVLTLAASCRRLPDITVTTREYTIHHPYLDMTSDLFAAQPDVIALSCYIWNWEMIKTLTALIKKVMPDVTIVLGGPEVSFDPEAIFQECPAADYLICGEGEEVLPRFIEELRQAGPVRLEGVVDRFTAAKACPVWVKDLDKLDFPYEDAMMEELSDKILYYESSRGCPFSCQYCLSSVSQGVRYRSLSKVFAELDFFVKHQVRQVKFVDRTFNARLDHYFPILEYIKKLDTTTNFHFEIAVELLSDQVIEFLADMPPGRIQFEIGVQSTYEPTLAAIDRNNRWEDIVRKVTRLHSFGNIHLHLDLIVGLPLETRKIFAHSFNDLYALQPDMLQIGFLKMLRGAKIRERAAEYDYVWTDQAPYEILANRDLPYRDVRELKIMENVFDQLYNKGRFQTALRRLCELSGQSFAFYDAFSRWWEKQGYHKQAHSPQKLFGYLLDYTRLTWPEEVDLIGELLKFDSLLAGGKVRPALLPWNERLYDEQFSAFWQGEQPLKYLKKFKFHNWRELRNQFHIEVFSVAADAYRRGDGLQRKTTVYLFDYRLREPVYYQLSIGDFGLEGEK